MNLNPPPPKKAYIYALVLGFVYSYLLSSYTQNSPSLRSVHQVNLPITIFCYVNESHAALRIRSIRYTPKTLNKALRTRFANVDF